MLPSPEQPSQCLAPSGNAVPLLLEAERAAIAAVEHCQEQAMQSVAASHAQADRLHQRTQARIERLRQRMTAAAQARQAQICRETETLAADQDPDAAILARLDKAIARVAEELAGTAESG